MDPEICDKLRNMINLTENFQAPIDGIDGLLGNQIILLCRVCCLTLSTVSAAYIHAYIF